jgi:hypothetical protein
MAASQFGWEGGEWEIVCCSKWKARCRLAIRGRFAAYTGQNEVLFDA